MRNKITKVTLFYILGLMLSLSISGCSTSNLNASPSSSFGSTAEAQHATIATQHITQEPDKRTVEPGTSQILTPTESLLSLVIEQESIPVGDHLVYYDWSSESLYLLSEDETLQDQKISDRWGSISKNTEYFAFIRNNNSLVIVDLVNEANKQIPLTLECYNLLSWSPDGERLAIECEDSIYIFSNADQSFRELTNWAQRSVDSFLSPQWSPDGKWIAYSYRQLSSLQLTPEDGVYLVEVDCLNEDSTCKERIQGVYFPYSNDMIKSWSPDSQYLGVFDQTKSIRILDISTHEVRNVIDDLDYIDGLAWSLDGNWLTYSIDGQIFKISPEGGVPISVAEDKGYVVSWISKTSK
jgi:Tol biopolymer transport system component